MRRITFTEYTLECIDRLKKEGRYSTAHLYDNALRSYTEYLNKPTVQFRDFSREKLRLYERWLIVKNKLSNTISTYMRMLRSIYNKGVDAGHAVYVLRLFHDVYTGVDTTHKKSLPRKELHTLLYKDPGTDLLRRTQCTARLLYQLCGMPFVDFVHTRNSDVTDGVLEYHRIKTGTKVCVKILQPVIDTMHHFYRISCDLRNKQNNRHAVVVNRDKEQIKTYSGYFNYQSLLRAFNYRLKVLADTLGVHSHVSSYTLRHSWATTAKKIGASIEKISESLGHKSIRTTQIYLSSFSASELATINSRACSYAENVK